MPPRRVPRRERPDFVRFLQRLGISHEEIREDQGFINAWYDDYQGFLGHLHDRGLNIDELDDGEFAREREEYVGDGASETSEGYDSPQTPPAAPPPSQPPVVGGRRGREEQDEQEDEMRHVLRQAYYKTDMALAEGDRLAEEHRKSFYNRGDSDLPTGYLREVLGNDSVFEFLVSKGVDPALRLDYGGGYIGRQKVADYPKEERYEDTDDEEDLKEIDEYEKTMTEKMETLDARLLRSAKNVRGAAADAIMAAAESGVSYYDYTRGVRNERYREAAENLDQGSLKAMEDTREVNDDPEKLKRQMSRHLSAEMVEAARLEKKGNELMMSDYGETYKAMVSRYVTPSVFEDLAQRAMPRPPLPPIPRLGGSGRPHNAPGIMAAGSAEAAARHLAGAAVYRRELTARRRAQEARDEEERARARRQRDENQEGRGGAQ